jgi:hypothetical protein
MFLCAGFVLFTSRAVRAVSFIECTVATSLFLVAYLQAAFRDPGYLPFNWTPSDRTKYSWRELMAGTAVTREQLAHVSVTPRPPGCSFSGSYGRYVIRADHICGWIANWVGKRNHKHFLLMMAWGAFAAVSLFAWHFAPRGHFEPASLLGIADFLAVGIEGGFAITLVVVLVRYSGEALTAQTTIDRYKGIAAPVDLSKREIMEQICGKGSVWCWVCPTDAFQSDVLLSAGWDGECASRE